MPLSNILRQGLILSLCAASPALADIYKYTAPDGRVFYTDNPPHKRYQRIIITPAPSSRKATSNLGAKRQYSPLITATAAKYQLDEKLLHAVIQTESAYQPEAVSPAGAVGLMQLMPGTARRYGVSNRRDPEQNIDAGARYLKDLLTLFNNNLKLAIAAYNAGENAVIKYHHDIPPYPETRNYVKRVLTLYQNTSL
ncbi:MAG: lytic transglycosylase domain-containing protein [Methylococcales bacterium]|nr:lytic transglycosylase domain-containing protein [Methylococcales bacterium]